MDVDVEGEGQSAGLKGLLEDDDQARSLSAFETLEKEFQDVLATLAGDESLDEFRAEYECGEYVCSRKPELLANRQRGWSDGGGRVNDGFWVGVVEVEEVSSDGIDESGAGCIEPFGSSENGSTRLARIRREHLDSGAHGSVSGRA